MADVTVAAKLEVDTGSATNSVKNFKQQLTEAQQEVIKLSEKFGATSKEAAAAAQRAAELKDQIGDAKSLIDAFNPDTKFRAFGAAINTVVGGFSALQGVMGLVGVESEETQKALLKVQSALAISQGISQLQEGVQTFKNLGAVIQSTTIFQKANAAATALASGAMRLFGVAAVQTGTAFQVLKVAIASTGIGLLVVALGTLIPKITEWISGTDDAAEAQDRLNESIQRVNDTLDENLAKIDFATKKELLQAEVAGKSERELQDIKEKGLRKELTQLTAAAFQKAALANRAIAEGKLEVDELNKIKDDAVEAEKKRIQKFQELQLSQLSFQSNNVKKIKSLIDKQTEDAKAAREKQLKEAEDEIKRQQENFRSTGGPAAGLNIEIPKSTEQLQIEATVAASHKALEEKTKIWEAESLQRSIAENDIRDKAINQMLLEEQVYQNRKVLLESTGNLFSTLGALIGKQTAAGKVLGIAQATINTFIGATEVLRAKSVLPEPFGTINKLVNVAAVIATGIAAVKNIVKTNVPGSGGGSVPSVQAPLQLQPAVQTSTRLDQQSLNAIGQASSRSYVLDADIENNRERAVRLNRAARLGG